MKIIVCYKLIPEEQYIMVNSGGSLNLSKADVKISPFDLNAIEAARALKQHNSEIHIVAMSVGGEALSNTKVRRDVLSRGPDALIGRGWKPVCRTRRPPCWLPPHAKTASI